MASENSFENWKELRSRVDSIANAVFLVGGGALSLSITVLLSNKAIVSKNVASVASQAWYLLLSSILLFLTLKIYLVFQAFMLQVRTSFVNRWLGWLNGGGWVLGIAAFCLFIWGMVFMVRAAVMVLNT